MYSVSVSSFEEWRASAREYLASNVAPNNIQWLGEHQGGLFVDQTLAVQGNTSSGQAVVPQIFLSQVRQASCFLSQKTSESKWSLFYSLLWRITKVDRRTLALKSDPEVQQLGRMVKSVNRDMHKMKAFVRFKSDSASLDDVFADTNAAQGYDTHYTAWFEPEHAIVQAISPFFAKRFTGMNWSILTPHGCVHWDRKNLIQSPGISRPDIQEDEFDNFWRAYYRNIFNPARLKEKAMQSEMPKKYWKYLPEAQCIGPLTHGAASRVDEMISAEETDSERVRLKSMQIAMQQDLLRQLNQL